MENTGGKDQRDCVVEEAGLFAASASEGIYSEEERQDEAARHTRDEMPRHASATSAGVGTHRGNHRRPEFLWVQAGTLNCRCRGTMLQCSGAKGECAMGAGGRYSRLFRQNQSRLDDRQYPHGQGDFKEMAQGGISCIKTNSSPPTPAPRKGALFRRWWRT